MRQTVHGPRSRSAFACYVFTSDARLLLTMRGQTKKTWPGVWSDSCHGHAEPGESIVDAVGRTLRDELGLAAAVVAEPVSRPGFQCVTASGEREPCVVFRVVTDEQPHPDPAQVGDFEWVRWAEFVYAVAIGDILVAPWCGPQVAEVSALGADPLGWPVAAEAVPPAA
jgi:isopentenyl-diphosphate delta-isomerase